MHDHDSPFVTATNSIDDCDLEQVTGAGFGEWFMNTIGYAGPSGASEAAAAIQPAAGVMAIAPQARNRNALIRDMAQNGGNYSEANFDRYNNGQAAKLSRAVGRW